MDNKTFNTKTYSNEERWEYLEENLKNNNRYKDFTSEKYEEGNFKGYIFTSIESVEKHKIFKKRNGVAFFRRGFLLRYIYTFC